MSRNRSEEGAPFAPTYAVGGLAFGAHTIYNDPQVRDIFRKLIRF